MHINLDELCYELKDYLEVDSLDDITVYYHWVVNEFVLEINGRYAGYCSCVTQQPAKKRDKKM